MGGGVNPLPEMQDEVVMSFLRQAGEVAEYVTSVCTGALTWRRLGSSKGYRATTHWAYKERLALYPGVEVISGRVVTDRNRITGGGVTALRYAHRAACRPGRCRRAAARAASAWASVWWDLRTASQIVTTDWACRELPTTRSSPGVR